MKIVILGDLHFISPNDTFTDVIENRAHFAKAWPSYRRLAARIRSEAPDLVISLGDVVDYYTPANRDFALELLDELGIDWVVTPGNHDFQSYRRGQGDNAPAEMISGEEFRDEALKGWAEREVDLSNRTIDADGVQLVLMESALSNVPPGTEEWLEQVLPRSSRNLIFTHVPLDIPVVADYILSLQPRRDLTKYVLRGAPHLFDQRLRGRAEAVFSGHLHFTGTLVESGTRMHLLSLSIVSAGRAYEGQGAATVIDLDEYRRTGLLTPRTLR